MKRTLILSVYCIVAVGIAGCSSDQNAAAPAPAPAPVATPAPPPPPPAMPANLTPAQQRIAKVQMALNASGAQLQVDGKIGPQTKAALKAYQTAHKLRPTGTPDAATLKALGG